MGGSSTKPEFTSNINNKRVKNGESIEFNCEANLEDIEVKWTKDGQRLYRGGRISISKSGTNLKLTITGAKEEDEGKYTVTISKDFESTTKSANVTVLEYDRRWRFIEWGVNVNIKHSLQDLTFRNPQVKYLRILLHGPVGSGKSSIINSINSIFQDKVKVGALAAAVSGSTFTKTFKTYQIRDQQNRALPVVFNDIMGLEKEDDEGVHPDDIISALKGHVRDNYKFNSRCPLSERDPKYHNHRPTVDKKVHCLVSVLQADKITLMDNYVINKMQDIRKHASEMGIPQVVFMTCVDLACPLVKNDLQRIYSSKHIKQKMQECSNRLGVPMNCIFPVKNYHEENKLDSNMDSLILDALKHTVSFACDYVDSLETHIQPLETHTQQSESEEPSEPSADEQSEDSCSGVVMDLNPVLTSTADREFDLEWRKINWDIGSRNSMEKKLREFHLLNSELKHLRILLHGPVGAGKSSFINSINSVFQGQICAGALVAAESGISFTKKYKTHKFRNGNSGHLPFVVNDIMGLEKGNSVGAHPSDIINALQGHVKNNYKFSQVSPLSVGDADYVASPSMSDRVHCLVSVIPLDKISIMDDEVINKMQAIREAATDMDIPQAIIMTMVDKACPVVKEDLRKIYFSKRIKQNMQECSNRLGVPMNCIFPVKNYHEETDLDQEMDCLILTALRHIVHFSREYIDSLDD
ncbi:hypothetical protein AALO_G00167230 [Alosa alosa]|uniref:Ig-like domain-containing protein n=1 Tax=Alosa alosa TaxID=278164 RepID=A0AAV6GG96_9TELE|nr:uncharacterized protein LOC125304961 isoform X1 [Alosa alosa]XP_048115485.1 uncharacterized protein LOC125304961 isoform X1 [Alosa alosa]XP_048115486.1 uncharacterized protein LOC125304961 isoform X1 [Alosa alosa]KAG5272592.1 hypothetical protein AALO_G00167230 [Alosa alosa]